jgi:hypothetical protein
MRTLIFVTIWVLCLCGIAHVYTRKPSTQDVEERDYKCRYKGGTVIGYKCFIGDKELTK